MLELEQGKNHGIVLYEAGIVGSKDGASLLPKVMGATLTIGNGAVVAERKVGTELGGSESVRVGNPVGTELGGSESIMVGSSVIVGLVEGTCRGADEGAAWGDEEGTFEQ